MVLVFKVIQIFGMAAVLLGAGANLRAAEAAAEESDVVSLESENTKAIPAPSAEPAPAASATAEASPSAGATPQATPVPAVTSAPTAVPEAKENLSDPGFEKSKSGDA